MKRHLKPSPRKFDWYTYLDQAFPNGITTETTYIVDLPEIPGMSKPRIRRNINMAIYRRYPQIQERGFNVHVRQSLVSEGDTEVYVG